MEYGGREREVSKGCRTRRWVSLISEGGEGEEGEEGKEGEEGEESVVTGKERGIPKSVASREDDRISKSPAHNPEFYTLQLQPHEF